MDHSSLLAFSLLLGLVSGFIGGVATGGGMIAIPGLIFLGLTPSAAIATTILTISASVSSAFRYHQSNLIKREYTIPFLWLTFLGGIIGSILLLEINGHIMQRIFGAVLLVLAPLTIYKKDFEFNSRRTFQNAWGPGLIFMTAIFASLFGTGGGIFMVYILNYFYGMRVMEANANAKVISLAGALSMIVIFVHAGIINFSVGIPLMTGSAIGGYIGAHTALKKGEAVVKRLFLTVVIASGIKLLLF